MNNMPMCQRGRSWFLPGVRTLRTPKYLSTLEDEMRKTSGVGIIHRYHEPCPQKEYHAVSFGVLLAITIGISLVLYVLIGG